MTPQAERAAILTEVNGVQWSDYRDWQAGHATAREAIEGSQHREAFMAILARFAAKANRYEQVSVMWWHAPYIYVEVGDNRHEYPVNMRALVSFDLTNGQWAGFDSKRRYVFARRGWQAFLERAVIHYSVPVYSEAGIHDAH